MHPPVSPVHLAPLLRWVDARLLQGARFEVHDPEGTVEAVRAGRNAIFVCRHGQLWPCLWAVRGTGMRILVSRSADGDLLARLLSGWGFTVARGSSSGDGISGARDALRALRGQFPLGLAVDGPRGPRGVIQEGALRLARRAEVPLIPLRVLGSGRWVLRRTWDHFEIPRPGGQLTVEFGSPIRVGPGPEGLASALRLLQRALDPPGEGETAIRESHLAEVLRGQESAP